MPNVTGPYLVFVYLPAQRMYHDGKKTCLPILFNLAESDHCDCNLFILMFLCPIKAPEKQFCNTFV